MKVPVLALATAMLLAPVTISPALAQDTPNILIIWGDDIGYWNVSAYNQGMMGYRTPNIDRIAREWMGHRPATPDSIPIICQSKEFESIYYAFGHGHTGLAGAPMTGKLISELIEGKPTSIDITPFDLYRF